MEKTCKHCGLTKPVEEFHKDRSKVDGLNFYCKPCTIARGKEFAKRPSRHISPEGMKRCSHCKETKPVAEFYNNKNTYDGLNPKCKKCSYERHAQWRLNNLEKAAAQQKEWRDNNKERYADYFLKRHYGLKIGDYAAMLGAQNGRCAICGTDSPGGKGRFHVDHDHATGRVRGLLCSPCNLGIGQLQHDKNTLLAAIRYLEVLPVSSGES